MNEHICNIVKHSVSVRVFHLIHHNHLNNPKQRASNMLLNAE